MRSVRRKRITGRAERVKDREREREGAHERRKGKWKRWKGRERREGESEGRTYRIRVYAPKRGRPRRGSRSALTYCSTFVAQSSLPPNFVAERTQKPRTLPAPLRQPLLDHCPLSLLAEALSRSRSLSLSFFPSLLPSVHPLASLQSHGFKAESFIPWNRVERRRSQPSGCIASQRLSFSFLFFSFFVPSFPLPPPRLRYTDRRRTEAGFSFGDESISSRAFSSSQFKKGPSFFSSEIMCVCVYIYRIYNKDLFNERPKIYRCVTYPLPPPFPSADCICFRAASITRFSISCHRNRGYSICQPG